MTAPLHAVITTIAEPTECVRRLAAALAPLGGVLVAVGDRKGPARFDLPGARFLPLEEQLSLPWRLPGLLPTGHYARKNLGYLLAAAAGAPCIYETDDDNAPKESFAPRRERVLARSAAPRPWVNVYRYFSGESLWPRGFLLDRIADPVEPLFEEGSAPEEVDAPIQQGLVDNAPDVDAIWRLTQDRPFRFAPGGSVVLPPGSWCPFNSQSTWWWPVAYPLLYLPSFCSFRMTDIWRSFVAQRCLWETGRRVVFHAAEVDQDRNYHDLMRDFRDEVPGYLGNRGLVEALESLPLAPGDGRVGENLLACYRRLVERDFLPEKELPLVEAWLSDLAALPPGA